LKVIDCFVLALGRSIFAALSACKMAYSSFNERLPGSVWKEGNALRLRVRAKPRQRRVKHCLQENSKGNVMENNF
jgi:hypothetical protein